MEKIETEKEMIQNTSGANTIEAGQIFKVSAGFRCFMLISVIRNMISIALKRTRFSRS